MPEIINLRQARKQKKRAEKEKKAERNRLSYGRTKEEKNRTAALKDKEKQELDGKKLT